MQGGIKRVGYMCKTDFDYELGHAAGGNRIFATVEDLKEWFPCVDECGIVKVEVSLINNVSGGEL